MESYLDIHIMDGYRFLMKHYQQGDKVCMFGFSRGAYTARCLAGMLSKVGLLLPDNDQMVASAYERYLDTSPSGTDLAKKFKKAFSIHCHIEFLGVWDTVASVGIITSKNLPLTANNKLIKTFRQALALDERRTKFRPNPWHEQFRSSGMASSVVQGLAEIYMSLITTCIGNQSAMDAMSRPVTAVAPRPEDLNAVDDDEQDVLPEMKTDVKEVWFVGGHSDVGGGNVDPDARNRISDPPLAWMINQIILSGAPIYFDEASVNEFKEEGFEVHEAREQQPLSEQDPCYAVRKVKVMWRMDDALETTNELDSNWVWWILEFLPFRHSYFRRDLNKWTEKRLGKLIGYQARAEVMFNDACVTFVDDFNEEVEKAHIQSGRLRFPSGLPPPLAPVALGPGMAGIPPPPPPPPLPPGWTEHTAPTGHSYYYHTGTNQSTYVRPLPTPGQPAVPSADSGQAVSSTSKKKKSRKEKPISKTPIPGTAWSRVKTSEGNVFYFHKERKESVWEIPEEIAEAVAEFEREEEEQRAQEERSPTPPPAAFGIGRLFAAEGKRKAEDPIPEVTKAKGKKPKVVVEDEKSIAAPDVEMANGEAEDDDEAWQRQVAEEMAAEEESAKKEKQGDKTEEQEKSDEKDKKEPPEDSNKPPQVNLSPEEARAMFKALLQEKDINPLTPYDSALPQLINDPRYVLLPNIADRHAAFNEYCLEKTRAKRAAKASSSASASNEANSAPVDEKLKAREAYEGLLRDELKSTRTSWDEWRKKWKKDRRFFGFGRDDREREKVFKEWRSTLGERKRKEAQKAEADFFALLRENEKLVTESTGSGNAGPLWKDVKKHKIIYSDPRYDAVGSSSLREELFQTYLKARVNPNNQPQASSSGAGSSKAALEDLEAKRKRERQERQEKALRERKQQAHKEMVEVKKDIRRSKGQLGEKESVDEFMTLLTDAIRDPTATYEESVPTLSRSAAFSRSRLPTDQQISLFNGHVRKLRDRQLTALFAVFEGYTPGLDARFEDLPESVYSTAPAVKLGLGQSKAEQDDEEAKRNFDERRARSEMRHLWEDWQAERNVKAREAFQKLLEENQFIGFWAGVNKFGKEGSSSGGGMGTVAPGVEDLEGEAPGEEEDNGLGKADLKTLAKGIGEKQIEDVLKEFVSRMSAPKLSVHVPDKA
ncbi:hypothetical protein FRC05_007968 [Tulasnella sp. 425]|nr:hypothetical protein FRC05_007968 [Tulasnella sp. 425]